MVSKGEGGLKWHWRGLTPCACVWIINSGVDVTEVYFAHEAIDLMDEVRSVKYSFQ